MSSSSRYCSCLFHCFYAGLTFFCLFVNNLHCSLEDHSGWRQHGVEGAERLTLLFLCAQPCPQNSQAKKTCWSVFQCPGTSSSFLSGFPRLHLGEGPRPPGISPSSRGAQRSARPGSPGWLISFMKSLS